MRREYLTSNYRFFGMVTGEGKIAIDVYVIIEKVETTKQTILKPIG